jgi:uncharacterized repeat protein (TIGR01451 family)
VERDELELAVGSVGSGVAGGEHGEPVVPAVDEAGGGTAGERVRELHGEGVMRTGIRYQVSGISLRGMVAIAMLLGLAGKASGLATSGVLLTNMVSFTYSNDFGGNRQIIGSYGATMAVLVQNPALSVSKYATPTLQASGSNVTFRVCVMNMSGTSSAFNVAVLDRLPDNMEWAGVATNMWSMGVPAGTWTEQSSSVFPGPYAAFPPIVGQDAPYYMRWVLTTLGPNRSACVEFQAKIL